jgi:ferritin-like metal-binding protein YciE
MTQHDQTDLIATWLKDAYAMETTIIEVLEKQIAMTADLPGIQAGIQTHLEDTRIHAESVQRCLEALGQDPSAIKAGMAKLGGKVQGLMMAIPEDSLIKNALHDYATEHMEIASYKALIIAAQEANLPDIADACQIILRDEEAMAVWLDQQLPTLVRLSLSKAS